METNRAKILWLRDGSKIYIFFNSVGVYISVVAKFFKYDYWVGGSVVGG